ncbi:metallophosphoesterase [uncultured Microbacterium sp.]|uniref:metallophosphoesterase family protein n=1 Tax=uncultured Microbacterium sp. TaxID=191216 RepID=UPI0028DD3E79|nr:metallophosphoesterase [uncultured Microbacterium sp.]
MATRLLLLADTHVPARARRLPDDVWRAVDEADVVVHAGDWVDLATFEALEERSRRLIAVWGNNDGDELRERMPEFAVARIEGVNLGVVHETGAARGREARMDARYPDGVLDLLVFGHSHIPWDSTTPQGIRLLNPGSPTDRRRQPVCTLMTATIDGDRVTDVTVVPVDRG